MKIFSAILLSLIFNMALINNSDAQGGIRFDQMSVKAGISKAKSEGKFLFVDTYAVWCIPCKKMKKVFQDKDVGAYFNDHYVNIKINMDGPNGKKTYSDYDVVFLPTMMIFDHEGRIKYKTDKLLTAQELLNIGVQANVEGVYLGNNASQIISTPFQTTKATKPTTKSVPADVAITNPPKKKEPAVESNSAERIVQVLGANDVMPPEVLYQEAYYQLQRMNDSQGEAAMAYLNTQEDWSLKKNVKFIFDFVESTNSPLFDYIKNNREHVAGIVGESNLAHSLDILVNQRIYQGYPRPNLEEAINLYALVDPVTAEQHAYQYYFNKNLQEENNEGYLSAVSDYLANVAPKDHQVMYQAAEVYSRMEYNAADWNNHKMMIDKAILLDPVNPKYYVTLAKLHLMKDERKEAKKAVGRAMDIMNENTGDLDSEITDILDRISKS